MSSLGEIRDARLKKLRILEKKFGGAYLPCAGQTHSVERVLAEFPKLAKARKKIVVAGRVLRIRAHGGSVFFDLTENGFSIQIFLKKDKLSGGDYSAFAEAVDAGDFVEVAGKAYVTRRKERSILAESWFPLAKSLRPLPEKWHGLKDVEERFRRRAIDLLSNGDVRRIFITRSKVISTIRSILDGDGFLEVETSMLQAVPGGAAARPFKTHHNALDIGLFLRIAPELDLKRLLVGGFTRVYEIGRSFRNEGVDATHNPEFTSIEAYAAYKDYEWLMKYLENMFDKIIKATIGKREFKYGGENIIIKKPFKRVKFYDALRTYATLPNAKDLKKEDLEIAAKRFGVADVDSKARASVLDDIFKKVVRPKLIQPTFVYDWPADLLPLAKKSKSDPSIAEAFQLYIGGIELAKAFSELNDPVEQARRFGEQEELREKGDMEASPADADFVENLEYGMPPAAGFGFGIERFVMLLTDTHNIREVILFPTLRPKT